MAKIKPFSAIRPDEKYAARVAALPYDVYDRREAAEAAKKDELTFLRIDRPETQFAEDADMYAPEVYAKAREIFDGMMADKIFIEDKEKCYYIYRLEMDGRKQTGIAACASVDDYLGNVIKRHENTREEKERDRTRHVDALSAQTGPVFLAYRSKKGIKKAVGEIISRDAPIYDFASDDGVRHTMWRAGRAEEIETIEAAFEGMDGIYIADGHHRAASAVSACMERRRKNPDYSGEEEFNYFLSVLFPDDELKILDYNRCVKDLNGLSEGEFFEEIGRNFEIAELDGRTRPGKKGDIAMYLNGRWRMLSASERLMGVKDVVKSLDVSLLQDYILGPVLGISDPRTDPRIDFVGGIRGLEELERRADGDMKASFAMYPTSIAELFAVADAGLLMPPKSTWFEPKLRSGLLIHKI